MKYNVAIVGATGKVGRTFLEVLEKRNFPINNLYLYASKNKKYQNLPKIMQEFFLKRNPNKERKS